VAAVFVMIRKNGAKSGIGFRKTFYFSAHFGERLYARKARNGFYSRVGGSHADAVPFFVDGILGGQKENLAWPFGGVGILLGRKKHEACAFLIMAGDVVKVVFLREYVGLGKFFAASEAPQDDRAFAVRREDGAAVGID